MSPAEQLELMEAIDRETHRILAEPSELDLERYYFYIEKGTDQSMIAPLPAAQFQNFSDLLAPALTSTAAARGELRDGLHAQISADYAYSMKKAIVDYILMCPEERSRLRIDWVCVQNF